MEAIPVSFDRYYTSAEYDPYGQVPTTMRLARITNAEGKVIFEQPNVEAPADWSAMATNLVASKYFRGHIGEKGREHSIPQLIGRVVRTIVQWGREDEYFATENDEETFRDELAHLLLTQKASFNSPVWFNVGASKHPQCSACFINSVDDSMDSIMRLATTEARLFKGGSGTGTNFSTLRSCKEKLSGGGVPSGPVSFMKGYDAFAGVIKSGGKTRRAAKMAILDISHPDIVEFINCKAEEERKAWALVAAGYEATIDGAAYSSIFFQNSNNSVRVPDTFMRAVMTDGTWTTHARTTGEPVETFRARDLLRKIAAAVHQCGDPGIQFDTTINQWHTCPAGGRIDASNPCGEYMFINDTACNLASLNLLLFAEPGTEKFDIEGFRHAVRIMITAQEIMIDRARYPTEQIAENSRLYRSLGIGYANLGALLMARGLPYDSDEGRIYAALITAIMTGEAYTQSARLAAWKGPFAKYGANGRVMKEVIGKHADRADMYDGAEFDDLQRAAREVWATARMEGAEHGFRNSQVSLLAPTGTIAFMMDCDTTGIEPDLALVKIKQLVGGGTLELVNKTVRRALIRLGYTSKQEEEIVAYLKRERRIEGAPGLREEHLPVFDCAIKPPGGVRYIQPYGHIHMLAAVQPFLSGAISKTVNMPPEATVEDIERVYMDAWKLGLKAVAVYREGSKKVQPLVMERSGRQDDVPTRRKLPEERNSKTHKFSVSSYEGYLTVGMYDDGTPGEIFIRMAKAGSVVSGLVDSCAVGVSIALQYGVPLSVYIRKYVNSQFEPAGYTTNPNIPVAKSILDYVFRWLALKFYPDEDFGVAEEEEISLEMQERMRRALDQQNNPPADAPACRDCGGLMARGGSCHHCANCGASDGCS